jgi:hypothetical protein
MRNYERGTMKYEVLGTMAFNVRMVIEADTENEAERKAMDRMDDGSVDGFQIIESCGDNEVGNIRIIK